MKRIKNQKNRRRRQILKRRCYLATAGICLLLIIIAIVGGGKDKNNDTVSAKTKKVIEDQQQEETYESEFDRVKAYAKTHNYPLSVIELLDKNEETIDFVKNYEKKKNQKAAKNIGVKVKKGTIPSLIQWDERWGYTRYGTSIIAVSGCGPTCMSMVVSGLTGNTKVTPARMAAYSMKNNLIDEDNNTYWEFMEKAAQHWGLTCREGMLEKAQMKAELKKGHPVICSVGPGNFTKNGHFIVLVGWKDGRIKVNDPFSRANTKKLWSYETIARQAKAMWVYQLSN